MARYRMSDLSAWNAEIARRAKFAYVTATTEVHRSVVEGSEITGSPGQPVDTSDLKTSWIPAFLEEWRWRTTTNAGHAKAIEEGQQAPYTTKNGTQVNPRAMTLRSKVGGFHSVALTRAGWSKIVAHAARLARGGG